jgi:hypothetical protein
VPIHLDRDTWIIFDLLTAFIFSLFIPGIKKVLIYSSLLFSQLIALFSFFFILKMSIGLFTNSEVDYWLLILFIIIGIVSQVLAIVLPAFFKEEQAALEKPHKIFTYIGIGVMVVAIIGIVTYFKIGLI